MHGCRKGAIAFLLLIAWLLPTGSTRADESTDARKGTLVWKIRPKIGIVEEAIDSISGLLTAEVAKYSDGAVISEEDMKTVLQTEEEKARCGVNETSCMAEIGNALGVPEVVSGDLGMVGDFWIINLRRIDVMQVRVISRVSRQVEGDISDTIRALPGIIAELYEREAGEVQADVPRAEGNDQQGQNGRVAADMYARAATQPTDYEIWGWTATGAGIAMLVVGALGTGMAAKTGNDYERGDWSAKSESDAWSNTMIAGYTIGGALLTTGIILLLLDPDDREDALTWREKMDIGFSADGDAFKVMFGGRW